MLCQQKGTDVPWTNIMIKGVYGMDDKRSKTTWVIINKVKALRNFTFARVLTEFEELNVPRQPKLQVLEWSFKMSCGM